MNSCHDHRIEFRHLSGLTLMLAVHLGIAANYVLGDQAYRPSDDNEVLETLPQQLLAGRDRVAVLRQELSEQPHDPQTAVRVAAEFIERGSELEDPRYFGYARAALDPWWNQTAAPPEILRSRADLKERDHLYEAALADLEVLLQAEPHSVQDWIEVSNINRVLGKYAEAQMACDRLTQFAGEIPSAVCRIPLLAATGEAERAAMLLEEIAPLVQRQAPGTMVWVHTMQAETARALGRVLDAEEHYKAGLTLEPGNLYLLRTCADFLLDQERAAEVIPLLEPHLKDNGILLRTAIAARQTHQDGIANEWQKELEERFAEIRLRGSTPHGRFEARWALELLNDPERALELSLANWAKQKEYGDTRIALEAAIAARRPDAAQPIMEFLKINKTQDVELAKLVRQLESMSVGKQP